MTHPLALIIYNRPNHLRRVIEALAPQKPEPLYIFADGPKAGETELVKETRDLAWNMTDWTERRLLVGRHDNVGLAASIVGAVDGVMKHNETCIVLEDDCVPGPYFMAFMEECLNRYEDDRKVLCCTGYTVNLPEDMGVDWDCYFMPRIETWGWGTWRHKWEMYRRDLGKAYQEALRRRVDLTRGGPDVPAMIEARLDGQGDSWSPGWMLACYLEDMYCVFPTTSHIQNIGMDGSGAHCGPSDRWYSEIATVKPTRFPKGFIKNKRIEDYVRQYHSRY